MSSTCQGGLWENSAGRAQGTRTWKQRAEVPAVDFVTQQPRMWSCGCCLAAKLRPTLWPHELQQARLLCPVLRRLLELAQSQVH